jgi:hypothetical protein
MKELSPLDTADFFTAPPILTIDLKNGALARNMLPGRA